MSVENAVSSRFVSVVALSLLVSACKREDAMQPGANPPLAEQTAATVAQENNAPSASDEDSRHAQLDDANITLAVKNTLAHEPGLAAGNIHVRTMERVVELTGTVPDLLAKRRAVQLAETVRGVRSVSDRIELALAQRSDAQVEREVTSALLLNNATDAYAVKVEVNRGVVTLTGTVQSGQEKRLAGRVAEGVRGVRGVKNKIAIDFVQSRSDANILADVKSRLRWDALVKSGLIDARVKDGEVFLSGVVGSAAERRRAAADAWVDGVKGVEASNLDVEWWTSDQDLRRDEPVEKTDQALASAIRDAAAFDPRVESATLAVDVQDGVATLRGVQETKQASIAAEALARNTIGVIGVRNDIKIEPGKRISDTDIEQKVRQGLLYNPIIGSEDLIATTHDGTVTLTGKVDTMYERAVATNVAADILGVRRVENDILVKRPEVPYVYNSYLEPYEPFVDHWRYTPSETTYSDSQIADQIQRELNWNPRIKPGDVRVQVASGTAVLTGSVATHDERKAATASAFAGGALVVDNRLKVTSRR